MDIDMNRRIRPDGANVNAARDMSRPPEWHRLRARLAAVHLPSQIAIDSENGVHRAPFGSFDRESAQALSDQRRTIRDVNPVLWANGKLAESKGNVIAGQTFSGDRG